MAVDPSSYCSITTFLEIKRIDCCIDSDPSFPSFRFCSSSEFQYSKLLGLLSTAATTAIAYPSFLCYLVANSELVKST